MGSPELFRFRITSLGRDILSGETAEGVSFQAPIIVTNSNIANLGDNFGTVHQVITNAFPPMPEDVRAALAACPGGNALIETLDDEIQRAQPRPGRLRSVFGGIKEMIDGANVGTEIAAHGHEWLAEMSSWIGDFFG